MDHAHSQGIIHRDLRPGNVLVTDQGMVKVADFGTSRFLEIAAHGTTVIGSPPYMAPEQFQGKAVFASDIYSLGVTMYQMFTGVLPYNTPMPADLEKLMKGELASPPKLKNPKLPKAISDIVMKAIAADIPSRYQRASDLLEAVLAARTPAPATVKRPWRPAPVGAGQPSEEVQEIQARLKARESVQARSAGNAARRFPPAPTSCPFCSETVMSTNS